MTWSLVFWLSLAPGQWAVLEVPQPSRAECEQVVPVVARFARAIGAHEFVVRCEVKR